MLFLSAAVAAAPVAPPVVNGDTTSDYEEVVLLYMTDRRETTGALCTGSLVNPEWVLTAAHCVSDSTGFRIAWIGAFVGKDSNHIDTEVEAEEWYPHPDYDGQSGYDDIALIHLADPIEDVPLMAVNFDGLSEDDEGEDFRIVGFGATSDDDNGGTVRKRLADVPLYDYDKRMMVTYDTKDDQNACHGDSGGPVLRLDEDDAYSVVGVMDAVGGNNPDCEGNGLVSARVDAYQDFIESYTEVYSTEELAEAGGGDDDEDDEGDGDLDEIFACSAAPGVVSPLLLVLAVAGARRRQSA